jgi:hypothetical protein
MIIMNDIENKCHMYISAYVGITFLDEYSLKPYILEELKEYILEYIDSFSLDIDFKIVLEQEKNNKDLRIHLQDALYTMNELNAPMELIHIIEKRIKNGFKN